jgi:hypothetical protein
MVVHVLLVAIRPSAGGVYSIKRGCSSLLLIEQPAPPATPGPSFGLDQYSLAGSGAIGERFESTSTSAAASAAG